MKSASIHTFSKVCSGSVVQSGRTLVSKTKCQRFKSFRGRQIMGCWYSWEHSGFASLSPRFEPGTVHQIGEREALVTSGDCKSSTLRYTGFESLALHHLTHNTRLCIIHGNRNNALVAEWPNAWDCKSQKPLVQIQPSAPVQGKPFVN